MLGRSAGRFGRREVHLLGGDGRLLGGQVQQGGRDGRQGGRDWLLRPATCDAAAAANNRANKSCQQNVRGEKSLVGLLFLICQVKNSKLLERGSFCSLVNFLGVVKSQDLPS